MTGLLADLAIGAAILALAAGMVAARSAFTATAFFIAYGLLLGLAWVRLGAVDIALTEAAIGAGLSGVLLLTAAARLAARPVATERAPGPLLTALIALCCAAVAVAIGAAILSLPEPTPSLAAEVAANLPATALGNPVAGVLMSYRALDTLLESAVVVLAVVGVWSLTPPGGWGGFPGPFHLRVESGPLALLARLLPPIGIVIALHILWVGKDAPGGKFQAAAILAAMWLLAWMAGLATPPRIASRRLRFAVSAGAGLFLAIGVAGALAEGAFLAYPAGWTKALVLAVEFALTASIAVALALLVMGPPEEEDRA
ncbi:DUF4040 domain-containing protein [Roseomonas eburnea]|uniref:DUF4040 domain-containing protein n=1 Tax=Neoroseomonas eburnea TaxID=1346889 RepID=A0A9X9XG52_9PROT|nr:hydrogenase subunit MbhD domain-containing protein [Neoroseomonas eburnea]MBR0682688.1 DUF4040 domain-containing protein [Neoroseomonas eburnea]